MISTDVVIWAAATRNQPPATRHPPPATRHPPPANRHLLPVPGTRNSASLWIKYAGAYSEVVEVSIGSFWLLENSEFVEALASRRL